VTRTGKREYTARAPVKRGEFEMEPNEQQQGNVTESQATGQTPPAEGEAQDSTSTQTGSGTAQPGEAKTFTQDEVNRLIDDRLRREREKVGKKYSDYDDLKTKAAEWQKLEDAKKSEIERMTAKLAEEQSKRAELEARVTQQALQAAVVAQAQKMGFVNPIHAWALIDANLLEIDDSGKVLGAEEALKALAKEYDYLVKKSAAPNLNPSEGGGQQRQPLKLTAEEIAAAEMMGMKPEEYAMFRETKNVLDYRTKVGKPGKK